MGKFTDGTYKIDSTEAILDAMLADAEKYWDEDLSDSQRSVFREFYRPTAEFLSSIEGDIQTVLHSTHIDKAEDKYLNQLTSLVGVTREPEIKATGKADFTRSSPASQDYTVPSGTVVQTDSIDPISYITTESGTILAPETVSDSATYSTSNTSFVTKTSFTVDVTHRETVDVSADFRTTNSSYTAYLEIADATNATTLDSASTTSTSMVTVGPTTYDVSGLSGDITIEYRIRTGNSSGTTELTNSTADKGGETGVILSIEAENGGVDSNTASNTIVVMPSPPAGVESVTNPNPVNGGEDRETDDELRERAKSELSSGSRASARGLVSNVKDVEGVTATSIFINDTNNDNTGSGGLPDHSFEIVISGGDSQKIAQTLLNTKAAGDTSYSGAYGSTDSGTGTLPNGDSFTIEFSRPSNIKIYVDASMDVTDEFDGKDAIKDSIVEYIGGNRTSGNETSGDLQVSEDVIYGEIEYAIRSVEGVYDISNLDVGTSSSPTGTANISIADHEIAISDGTDSSITLSTTQI